MLYDPTNQEESIKYIIYNAPYGGLSRMVDDLRLACEYKIEGEGPQEAIRFHQQDNYEIFSGSGHKFVVSRSGYLEESDVYVDSNAAKAFKVNHLNAQITEVIELSQIEAAAEMGADEVTKLLAETVKKYLEELYTENTAFTILRKGGNYEVIYTCKVNSPGNFYDGSWAGHFTYTSELKSISGSIILKTHTYEDGNAFFEDKKEDTRELEVSPSEPKEFVAAFFETYCDVERKMVKRLSQHFDEDSDKLFKTVRLPLPFTRQTINWDTNIQTMVETLKTAEER